MYLDFLTPIHRALIEKVETLSASTIGRNMSFYTQKDDSIDFSKVKIALLGIRENRRETNAQSINEFDFTAIREAFYSLYMGNWDIPMIDLGDILPGEDIEDTDYAAREILTALLENDVIPIILGGSQDMTFNQYRAYTSSNKMVNLVNIDPRFDIGDIGASISDTSYIGKMIVEEPHRLSNYANIGYQSYLNPPEEIELIENLYFEAYRLGEICNDISASEPILRDADLISMDIEAVANLQANSSTGEPNGFNGREICALARYAGISDRTSSYGLYNLHKYLNQPLHTKLVAQILWYIVEGINFRKNEKDITNLQSFTKYNVPLTDDTLIFYRSKQSGRWWVEVPVYIENRITNKVYLPCSKQEYDEACQNTIPERWYKARYKNEL